MSFNFINGQDIHFSQFNNSPLNLNPGLTGSFNGEFRFVANQRTQWSSVTTPYSTFGVSLDAKHIYKLPINIGLSLYNDKAGDGEFSTLQIGLSGGYSIYLGDSSQTINITAQPTITQRSINFNKLNFDNQYDGVAYNSNLGNGETFANSGNTYFNLHAGLVWNYQIAQRKSVAAGLALHNILTPEQGFFNENIPLNQRITLHTNALFRVSDRIDALPSILVMTQQNFKEIVFGGSGKYHLNKGDYKAFYLGVWYRNQDASYFTAELDWRSWHFGISYDLNLSTLNVASNYQGGFEFSAIYILQRFKPDIKRYRACPNFI